MLINEYLESELYYSHKCPLIQTKEGELFFDRFLINKSLRRYFKSIYLPLSLEGKDVLIVKDYGNHHTPL